MNDKEREQKIERLLSRNVEEVIDREHLRAALTSGKKLRVKLGIDPTSPDLHLGHAVVLRKLREFQDLGCTAILIIGDFTAQIGDPSGRDKTRPPLTPTEVKENMRKYLKQAAKILDIGKAEIAYNSRWLGKLKAADMIMLQSKVSFQQVAEREDFARRLAEHKSVQMHELTYPLLVAYDSVEVRADVEMGGSDQLFNFLMGRALMEKYEMPPQDVFTALLLVGLDGVRKMSKSLGNYVGLDDEPNDMFGKIMSIPDALIESYFILCTEEDVEFIKKELKSRGPRDVKAELAFQIVELYHGKTAAKKAREHFEKVFSRHELPDDLPELKIPKAAAKNITILDLAMLAGGLAGLKSRGEARRLIEGGGFELAGEIIKNPLQIATVRDNQVVRMGKWRFFKTKLEPGS